MRRTKEYREKKLIQIKEYLASEGYEVLSEEYIDSRTDLIIKCPKGHIYKAKWVNIYKGNRCRQCHLEKFAKYNIKFKGISREEFRKKMHNEMLEDLKREGYTYVKGEYINNKSPYTVICPKGHEFETDRNKWFSGKRCRKCFEKRVRKSFDEIAEELAREGCELLEWNGSDKPMLYICSCGNQHRGYIKSFRQGARCSYCTAQKRKEKIRLKKLEMLKEAFKE